MTSRGKRIPIEFLTVLGSVLSGGLSLYVQMRLNDEPGALVVMGHLWSHSALIKIAVVSFATSTLFLAAAVVYAEVATKKALQELPKEYLAGQVFRQAQINGALAPTIAAISELVALPNNRTIRRGELHGRGRTAVLFGAVNVFGTPDTVRACYYELDDSDPKRPTLVFAERQGRDGTFTNPFVPAPGATSAQQIEATAATDEAVKSIIADQARAWSRGEPTPPGVHNSKSYCAFIAVPVARPGKTFGMLAIDSCDRSTFIFPDRKYDINTLVIFARLLAVTLSS